MNVEFDDPKDITNITEMRAAVHEWLTLRPTIKHTPLTLFGLVLGEMNELQEAIAYRKPPAQINLEVGDILFSLLALDDRGDPIRMTTIKTPETRCPDTIATVSNLLKIMDRNKSNTFGFKETGLSLTPFGYGKLDTTYSLIFKYCEENNIRPIKVFRDTNLKNQINYPFILFNEMTPFFESKDAIACLRIFRNVFEDPESLDKHWALLDRRLDAMPFFDGWWAIGHVRDFIRETLELIAKSREQDQETTNEIDRLLSVGKWDREPFKIPNNQFNWHIW